jgi:hypothetical protein
MAKSSIRTYSTTAASNTDVGGLDIQGTAPASNMNDAVQEIMSHLAETNAGTSPVDDTWSFCDPADATKKVRIDAGSVSAGQTRVLTMPDANVTLPSGTLVTEAATQTLTNKTLTTPTITLKQGAAAAPTAEGDIQWDTDDNRLVIGDGAATQTFTPNPASTTAGDTEYYTAANTKARLAKGTAGQALRMNSGATAPEWGSSIVSATAQASTSGTSIDFTSIPSWVRRITVLFSEVSLSGTDNILVQIGTGGGIESTVYDSSSGYTQDSAVEIDSSTGGFVWRLSNSARYATGRMTIEKFNGNTWVAAHAGQAGSGATVTGGGSKTLSGTLDRVRILTTGTNTFDAGSVNITYE